MDMATIWPNFGKMATFYSNIWSHCHKVLRLCQACDKNIFDGSVFSSANECAESMLNDKSSHHHHHDNAHQCD